jgi:WD40 repeat protein
VLPAATVRAALAFASGADATARAAVLAEEALRGVGVGKMGLGIALLLAAGMAAVGVMGGPQAPAGPPEAEPRPAAPAPEKKQAAKTDLYGDPLPEGAVARLGTLRFRGTPDSRAVLLAYAPDGKTLARLEDRGTLCLFEAASGRRIDLPLALNTTVSSLAFAPDGTRLALACGKSGPPELLRVEIWDLTRKEKLRAVLLDSLEALTWSADGRALLTLEGAAIRWRDSTSGRCLRQVEQKWLPVYGAGRPTPVFSADGRFLFGEGSDERIHLVELETNRDLLGEKANRGYIHWLAIAPDGRAAALAGEQGVRLWRMGRKMEKLTLIETDHRGRGTFAPDGQSLATIDREAMSLWDVPTGKERRRIAGGPHESECKVAFSPDGTTLASARESGGAVHFWDVATGRLKAESQGHVSRPGSIAFAPDGIRVATSGGFDSSFAIWEIATGRPRGLIRLPFEIAVKCAFSADGCLLYATATGSALRAFDPNTGRMVHSLPLEDPGQPDTRQSGAALFSVDGGNGLIVFSRYYPAKGKPLWPSRDMLITGWDLRTRRQFFRRRLQLRCLGGAVSPDGRLLAVADQGATESDPDGMGPMQLQELATGRYLYSFGKAETQTFPRAFSPDGRLLASHTHGYDGGLVRLWEVASGARVLELPCACFGIVAFSADGRFLAVASRSGGIVVWDLVEGREAKRFSGHERETASGAFLLDKGFPFPMKEIKEHREIVSLAFSPDGRWLISGATDTTLLVWDVAALRHNPAARRVTADAQKAWTDLAAGDPVKALAARWALAEAPEQALPLLKERLAPARETNPARLRQLLAALDSPDFEVREKASRILEDSVEVDAPALRKALEQSPSAEVRRRLKLLLERLERPVTAPQRLRDLRALAVLESIGGAEARAVLHKLAGGAAGARLTEEAKAALARLGSRGGPPQHDGPAERKNVP